MKKSYRFDAFVVQVIMREDQPEQSFLDLLNDAPEIPRPVGRSNGNFILDGSVYDRDIYKVGTFKFVQMTDIPPMSEIDGDAEPLPLGDRQGLAHYTTFIYDSARNIVLIESTQSGVSASGFIAYYTTNHPNIREIRLDLATDPLIEEKLTSYTLIKKLQIKVARYVNGGFFSAQNQDFNQISRVADNTDSDTIDVTLSAGRGRDKQLNRNRIVALVRSMMRWNATDEVKNLIISGIDDHGETKLFDFVTNRVKIVVSLDRVRHISNATINIKVDAVIREYVAIRDSLRGFTRPQ